MSDTPNKFYLTTPIYYVNARPHIGHAYSTIAADVIARRHRLLGDDTLFLTGTDEHGQKVQRSAEAAGIPPQQFADQVSKSFEDLWKRMGITNDDYIRTTDERHKRGVQKLWRELESRGAIYLSSYTGQYCVSDEAFVDVPVGAPCPTCGRITETITEENYFFKLSEYQEKLIDLIESGTLHIQPETARNEVLSFLRGDIHELIESDLSNLVSIPNAYSAANKRYIPGALKDLSISRTTFDWGIKVPGNDKHVVYVWLDALANYITAIGYGAEDRDDLTAEQKQAELAKFAKYWPADLHLVGKEITRFHCVYWPAFLMAAGLPTPKSVVANGWLLFEESKMSKSRGNVVRTETILDAFGPLCPPVLVVPDDFVSGSDGGSTVDPASRSDGGSTIDPAPRSDGGSTIDPAPRSDGGSTVDPASRSDGGSRGLQPPESTPKDAGALAPGLVPPTKVQQDLFAADVLRYFLLREIPFGQDGSFSFDALITRYNADLANGYGNLVSRTLSMIDKYFGGTIQKPSNSSAFLEEEGSTSKVMRETAKGSLASYDFARYIGAISTLVAAVDRVITLDAPWKLAADQTKQEKLTEILYTAAESIRLITVFLYPVMPYATASVWAQLGLGSIEEAARNGELKDLKWGGLKPGTKLGPLAPIFPRADKGLAQIMTDMENPTTPEPAKPEPAKAAPPSHAPTAEALNAASPAAVNPPAASAAPSGTATISIDDFAKVDLRVAQIVVAERIPKADKLLRLEVDLGPSFDPPRRQILAGIAEYYQPESLIGRKVVIVANLAPRKMRGLESNGMIVAASIGPNGAPVLAGFLEDVELGARLK